MCRATSTTWRSASTTPTPVIIANQRVNGTGSQSLTVSNTAAAGNYTEASNASIGGTSGTAIGSGGPVNNIAAGASNTGGLSVGVNTTSSGAKTGVVTIAYQSDGTGSNGHSGPRRHRGRQPRDHRQRQCVPGSRRLPADRTAQLRRGPGRPKRLADPQHPEFGDRSLRLCRGPERQLRRGHRHRRQPAHRHRQHQRTRRGRDQRQRADRRRQHEHGRHGEREHRGQLCQRRRGERRQQRTRHARGRLFRLRRDRHDQRHGHGRQPGRSGHQQQPDRARQRPHRLGRRRPAW